jgi:DNA-binding NtrC family response regulator
MARILIVDDEPGQRHIMRAILMADGHEVMEAGGVEEAEVRIKEIDPELILTDLKMPQKGGLVLVERVSKLEFPPEVVVITAFGTIETAVKAMRLGAYDYLTKPLDGEEFQLVVHRALEKFNLREERRRLQKALDRKVLSEIVFQSASMREIVETSTRVAESDATVLVRGESGTGKERIARLIHQKSPRRNMPFQSINCAAFTESLLESELFGHEKGAFTGAHARKVGIIESASGGTLFLDEIGDMSPSIQTKILRVIQEKEIRRVGSTQSFKVDVRIIAATHRNLEEAISQGQFREDLYYRLNIIPIVIPPLRERREDIAVLAHHFLEKGNRKKSIEPEAIDALAEYDWPGNVRELEAVMERVSILTPHQTIRETDIARELRTFHRPQNGGDSSFTLPSGGVVFEDVEHHLLKQAMDRTGANMTEAAKLLGMSYRTFRYRALKFGIMDK